MKKILFLASIIFPCNSTFSGSLEFGIEPFEPPHPIIEVQAKKVVKRHGAFLNRKAPHVFPDWKCLILIPAPKEPKLSLQFIGSRETWIPINGTPKIEYFYRVN